VVCLSKEEVAVKRRIMAKKGLSGAMDGRRTLETKSLKKTHTYG
jgi:hypothetical protein